MMKEKTRFVLVLVLTGILLGLFVPIFLYASMAYADPATFNYRLAYLQEGEAVDGYLHTGEYSLALVFGAILAVLLILLVLDWIFRKKATHILLVEVITAAAAAYAVARSIYCFKVGSVSVIPGIIYLLALLGILGSAYFFAKKTLDGDSSWPYHLCFIWGAVFLFFASATQHSYSILNANGHQGDVVYWGCYGVSRLYLLSYILVGRLNASLDYLPEAKPLPQEAQEAK